MPKELELAREYHGNLPARIRQYLTQDRGISGEVIERHLLGWNGNRITIPVFNRSGGFACFKLAKDPEDKSDSPKMLASPGAKAELYGWERVLAKPDHLIICEGEFDRLVLESQGFAAVTSTGGAGTFRREWAEALREIPEVYVCFDRDDAGQKGAERVGGLIPRARLVELPEEVGEGGDVTDFFVRLKKSREDFLRLFETAVRPLPEPPAPDGLSAGSFRATGDSEIARLKSCVRLEELVGRHVALRQRGTTY